MSPDLIAFLRARLDDDERVALKAKAMRWDHPSDAPWERARILVERDGEKAAGIGNTMAARFGNPDRALAGVDFSRRLLDWLVDCEGKALDGNWWNLEVEDALKALAQPFASHPGFRDEWRIP